MLRFVHESRYEEMVAAMKDEAAKAKQVTNDGLLVRSTYMAPGNRHFVAILESRDDSRLIRRVTMTFFPNPKRPDHEDYVSNRILISERSPVIRASHEYYTS